LILPLLPEATGLCSGCNNLGAHRIPIIPLAITSPLYGDDGEICFALRQQ
jgi:hypothetical protein